MEGYTLGVLPMIHFLLEFISLTHLVVKEVVFADDFTTSLILKTTGENYQFLVRNMVITQKLQNDI